MYAVTACFGFISLILLHRATAVALVLALTGTGVLVGVHQLRYGEFGEMLSILQRAARQRRIVANHVAVRHAAESLESCDEFRSICRVLRDTLQPVGFDGIRLQMLHPNGFLSASFLPMKYEPDGKLLLSWSERGLDDPPWELRLELVSNSKERWGYVSLIPVCDEKTIALDMNALTGDFRVALSKAVERACSRMNAELESEIDSREPQFHRIAAGS